MIGNPGALRGRGQDNRSDQARAHLQAEESAEEQLEKPLGEVLPKTRDIHNGLK
jgi:hypothetical protein